MSDVTPEQQQANARLAQTPQSQPTANAPSSDVGGVTPGAATEGLAPSVEEQQDRANERPNDDAHGRADRERETPQTNPDVGAVEPGPTSEPQRYVGNQ